MTFAHQTQFPRLMIGVLQIGTDGEEKRVGGGEV